MMFPNFMRWELGRHMVWTIQLYRLSIILLSSQSWPMLLVPGGASPMLLIDRKSTHSSNKVSKINSYHQTFHCLPNCVMQQMILFQCVTTDRKQHILHDLILLPSVASLNYNLRQHRHNLEFPSKSGCPTDCNFIQRMLFLDCYWRAVRAKSHHSEGPPIANPNPNPTLYDSAPSLWRPFTMVGRHPLLPPIRYLQRGEHEQDLVFASEWQATFWGSGTFRSPVFSLLGELYE